MDTTSLFELKQERDRIDGVTLHLLQFPSEPLSERRARIEAGDLAEGNFPEEAEYIAGVLDQHARPIGILCLSRHPDVPKFNKRSDFLVRSVGRLFGGDLISWVTTSVASNDGTRVELFIQQFQLTKSGGLSEAAEEARVELVERIRAERELVDLARHYHSPDPG